MPSIHHHKKTMLRAILVTLGVFSLPFSALASTDCFFRLSPSKYSLSEVRPEIDYLESVIPGFGTIAQQYAIDTVHFYLPRTRNAKSVIKDLAYTLQFIERNPQEGWNNELRYQVFRVFSEIQSRKFRVTNGINDYPGELREYFLKNYETYRPLINRHLSTYHSAYFFDPCPSGTPYYFFHQIAALELSKSQPSHVSDRDILKEAGFRHLEGSRLFSRNYYYVGTLRPPSLRIVAPPCDREDTSPVVADYEYDVEIGGWKKTNFRINSNLDVYQWFSGGFSDFGHHEAVKWRVTTDRLYEAYQKKQANRFKDLLERQGIFAKLPTNSERECHKNDD